ncbi:MAG: cobalamin biosynthesis protein [Dehalococcoidales bacterium]|nr:cobalamin biosynthesis protein [Dehalococcoidales bacterium]
MDTLAVFFVALVIDLVLGEPPRPIHPVVWMGRVTSFLEKGGWGRSPRRQFVYGAGMTLFLIGLFAAAVYLSLFYLRSLSAVAYVVVGAVLLKSTFSLRELRRAAIRIKRLLLGNRLNEARYELRSLVSRDTADLSEPMVVSAAIESVAENIVDSFVAPLFYFLLFGVPGAVAYRVVNTLDAMIGYHGKYEYLGKFACRLDDVLNFIPARVTVLLLVLASFLSGRDARAAWRVALNEHSRTESPNAGWTMAATAGALNVQLVKVGHYRLGAAAAPLVPQTIDDALRLMLISMLSWAGICFAAGVIRFAVTT